MQEHTINQGGRVRKCVAGRAYRHGSNSGGGRTEGEREREREESVDQIMIEVQDMHRRVSLAAMTMAMMTMTMMTMMTTVWYGYL